MTSAVEINVPDADRTVRSPTDALRFVVAMLVASVTVIIVIAFPDTFGGLGRDLSLVFEDASEAAAEIAGLGLTAIVLAIPLVLVVFFIRRRDLHRLAIVALAAAIGAIATSLGIAWLTVILRDTIVTPEYGSIVVAQTAYYPYVAALSAAITAASPWMPRRWERIAWGALTVLVILRLVFSSTLPAELVLALALGVASGSALLFALGSPNRQPTGPEIVATLRRAGIDPIRLDVATVDARGSTPYFLRTGDGDRLFVKTLSTDERSADLLFHLYRRFRFKNVGDEPAFSSLRRAVEHEALLSYGAAAVGVRTPRLVTVGRIGDEDYSMLLAQHAVDGQSLDSVPPAEITDEILSQAWRQVAILREHGIAHRDLRLANLLLDEQQRPWIIDFGISELSASHLLLDNDVAEFVASSALLVGPERSVRCAIDVLGPDPVSSAARRLQPGALSGATRTALKERGDALLERLRAEIARSTDRDLPPLDRLNRLRPSLNHRSANPTSGHP